MDERRTGRDGVRIWIMTAQQSLREHLDTLRARMAGWARATLEQFKQAGVSALDKAMAALNVKDGLEQIQAGIQGGMEALRGGIRRIDRTILMSCHVTISPFFKRPAAGHAGPRP